MTTAMQALTDAQQEALAHRPASGGFPYLAEVLRRAGVRRNEWHLPTAQAVYETDLGSVVQLGPTCEPDLGVGAGHEVAPFDEAAVVAAIRADQAGKSTFPEFLRAVWLAGVFRYVVDLDARTVTYHGSAGASYIEPYPAVQL